MFEIQDSFTGGLHPAWQVTEQGAGQVTVRDEQLHLSLPHASHDQYSNAQISSYDHNFDFRCTPPLRLTVRAHSPTPVNTLRGTAGFGFWNHAFAPGTRRIDLPQALWFFFASPDSNMALAEGVTGHGWKAATFNARRWQFLALLPTAPLAIPLMNWQTAYDALWNIGQRAIGVQEAPLALEMLNTAHTYTLDWLPDKATFAVDDERVLVARTGIPHGALGFVAWVDNQYAVVTPQGNFGYGLLDVTQQQSLIFDEIKIETL